MSGAPGRFGAAAASAFPGRGAGEDRPAARLSAPSPARRAGVWTRVCGDSTGSRVRRRRRRSSATPAGTRRDEREVAGSSGRVLRQGLQSYWAPSQHLQRSGGFCRSLTMARTRRLAHRPEHRVRALRGRFGERLRRRPRPRRPGSGGPSGYDQHTLMVRRRVAAGAAVVLLIVIVLVINGCLKRQKTQSLKDYNHARHARSRANPIRRSPSRFFTALSGAAGKSAIDVEVQVDQLRVEAQKLASRAKRPERPRRDDRRAAQPALGAELPRRRDHEDRGAAAGRARRPGQAGEHRRSPATWRSSWPPT